MSAHETTLFQRDPHYAAYKVESDFERGLLGKSANEIVAQTGAGSGVCCLAKKCCGEILFTSLSTGAVCSFAEDAEVAKLLLTYNLCILAMSIFARSAIFYAEAGVARLADHDLGAVTSLPQPIIKSLPFLVKILKVVPNFLHAYLYESTWGILFHEGGHAAAAALIYRTSPKITITDIGDGFVSDVVSEEVGGATTAIEKILGSKNAELLFCGSGALATTFLSTMGILLALQLGKKCPDISRSMFICSLAGLYFDINYALEALPLESIFLEKGQEFMKIPDSMTLWKTGGIHPYVSVGCMIGIPTIATLGYLYKNRSNR